MQLNGPTRYFLRGLYAVRADCSALGAFIARPVTVCLFQHGQRQLHSQTFAKAVPYGVSARRHLHVFDTCMGHYCWASI